MKKFLFLMAFALSVSACVYPFEADVAATAGEVVIEGDIVVGGLSYFSVSNAVDLKEESTPELLDAEVYVEDSNGHKYESRPEISEMGYVVDLTFADELLEYRLVVKVAGKEYTTPWSGTEGNCVIDDVNYIIDWDEELLKIRMSLHTEDGSRHFRYRFSEIWEYHSYAFAECYYSPTVDEEHPYGRVIDFPYGENIYYCWKYESSRGINLATTEDMSEDRLVNYPFKSFGRRDDRLSILYKITLDVYPVSADSYKYYDNLRSVSAAGGDLFSPIPSAMRGNIKCTAAEDEMVYGYVAVVKPQTRKLYIERKGEELEKFYLQEYYNPDYEEIDVVDVDWYSFYRWGYVPLRNDPFMGTKWAPSKCVDCRKAGGTKVRPEDWPNDHR